MMNVHRVDWQADYKTAVYPFYNRSEKLLYRPTFLSTPTDHGDEARPCVQVEFLPTEIERRTIAEGGLVTVIIPDVETPPEFQITVSAEKDIVDRASKIQSLEAIAMAMYENRTPRPPVPWRQLDAGAITIWLQNAETAITMVLAELDGEKDDDAPDNQ